jgi:hypothetical protein
MTSDKTEDITERLDKEAALLGVGVVEPIERRTAGLFREAAAALRSLGQSEAARTGRIDDALASKVIALEDELAALRSENAALVQALTETLTDIEMLAADDGWKHLKSVIAARAALGGTK